MVLGKLDDALQLCDDGLSVDCKNEKLTSLQLQALKLQNQQERSENERVNRDQREQARLSTIYQLLKVLILFLSPNSPTDLQTVCAITSCEILLADL